MLTAHGPAARNSLLAHQPTPVNKHCAVTKQLYIVNISLQYACQTLLISALWSVAEPVSLASPKSASGRQGGRAMRTDVPPAKVLQILFTSIAPWTFEPKSCQYCPAYILSILYLVVIRTLANGCWTECSAWPRTYYGGRAGTHSGPTRRSPRKHHPKKPFSPKPTPKRPRRTAAVIPTPPPAAATNQDQAPLLVSTIG